MSVLDKSIFRPAFFHKAGAITLKVVAGAEVVIRRPAVFGLGLSFALASAAVGGESVSVSVPVSGGNDAAFVAKTELPFRSDANAPVQSSLTKDELRASLAAKHGDDGLREKLRLANAALRRNASEPDADSSEALTVVRTWVAG